MLLLPSALFRKYLGGVFDIPLAEWRENLIKLRAQYEAIELNYSYLGEECLAEWRENLIKLRAQFQD